MSSSTPASFNVPADSHPNPSPPIDIVQPVQAEDQNGISELSLHSTTYSLTDNPKNGSDSDNTLKNESDSEGINSEEKLQLDEMDEEPRSKVKKKQFTNLQSSHNVRVFPCGVQDTIRKSNMTKKNYKKRICWEKEVNIQVGSTMQVKADILLNKKKTDARAPEQNNFKLEVSAQYDEDLHKYLKSQEGETESYLKVRAKALERDTGRLLIPDENTGKLVKTAEEHDFIFDIKTGVICCTFDFISSSKLDECMSENIELKIDLELILSLDKNNTTFLLLEDYVVIDSKEDSSVEN